MQNHNQTIDLDELSQEVDVLGTYPEIEDESQQDILLGRINLPESSTQTVLYPQRVQIHHRWYTLEPDLHAAILNARNALATLFDLAKVKHPTLTAITLSYNDTIQREKFYGFAHGTVCHSFTGPKEMYKLLLRNSLDQAIREGGDQDDRVQETV